MPTRGPLSCDQLSKRHQNAKTDKGRARSLSSAIRKGCAWAASMEPPNPCEPKARAFVTKKDREVAFAVSGGDCPPGVRADPTERDKQRVKDAKAACGGVRPSLEFKSCVLAKMARPASSAPMPAPMPAMPPMPLPPEPILPPGPPPPPPRLTLQQLPPGLRQAIAQKLAPLAKTPAPRPSLPSSGDDLPPLLPPPPPASGKAKKIQKLAQQAYVEATDRFLAYDWPLRYPLNAFDVHDPDFYNYLRRTYPKIPICERTQFRARPTLELKTDVPAVRHAAAERLVAEYGED